ncbi:hypothetical protein ACTXGL_05555 [Psychrobacter sp. T6-6]|uniref:hypothetical protein n=1 Tax=Psychrobacter sp. T6-6 TaxID=3457452 RepID=UPI003FCFAF6A
MNMITKIATALPALALLSACATTAPETTDTPVTEKVTAAYDRMAPAPYTCTDGSKIMAKQSINKEQVMVNATLPKVKWAEQPVVLNGGIKGDVASYVNDSNPEVIYAWHMKEDKGIFAMKWANGKEYKVNCQI